jgi:hypothetical protein
MKRPIWLPAVPIEQPALAGLPYPVAASNFAFNWRGGMHAPKDGSPALYLVR